MTKEEINNIAARYSALLMAQVGEMFQDDSENHINIEDLQDDGNLKAFIHAFSTMFPCVFFNRLTKGSDDHLTFNHMANRLIFELCTVVDEEEDEG